MGPAEAWGWSPRHGEPALTRPPCRKGGLGGSLPRKAGATGLSLLRHVTRKSGSAVAPTGYSHECSISHPSSGPLKVHSKRSPRGPGWNTSSAQPVVEESAHLPSGRAWLPGELCRESQTHGRCPGTHTLRHFPHSRCGAGCEAAGSAQTGSHLHLCPREACVSCYPRQDCTPGCGATGGPTVPAQPVAE